ncbi:MAG: polysaccharide biosynthesis C-terminal domain-containing protein, partial [Gallionellaceae bacterium]
ANDLAARGLVGINLALGVFVLLVNTLGNLLLIPSYGIAGAAIATSFAAVANLVLRLIIHQRITETRWWRFLLILPEDFQRLKMALRKER